jgi:hypothetical protein
MRTIFLVLDMVQIRGADKGNLTAINLSIDIPARNRPDNVAVVFPKK